VNNSDNKGSNDPVVWVLAGRKAGDNTQLMALAEALGWRYEIKKIRNQPWELLTNRLLGASLAGVDRKHSDQLEPPWPDLVLTAGRRNEPVARWIRRQSGGRSRLVHVGRPWAPLACFDLIVTTPQYFLPDQPNVLSVDLPLHGQSRTELDQLAIGWFRQFSHLSKPYWAVLLGGDSGPFVFTPAKAKRLAHWLNVRLGETGGAVLVSNSARTPDATYRAFLDALTVPVHAYHWGSNEENPYHAYLAVADHFVVTGESMSMLSEAAAAERPLYVFDLSDNPTGNATSSARPWWTTLHNFRYKPLTHRLAMWLAPQRLRRDVSRIQEKLVADGAAAWAGQGAVAVAQSVDAEALDRAASAVRQLFDKG